MSIAEIVALEATVERLERENRRLRGLLQDLAGRFGSIQKRADDARDCAMRMLDEYKPTAQPTDPQSIRGGEDADR